jgi:hypothetical protein
MSLWLRVAIAGTESWCKAYTRGLPAPLRQARRDELESDMWEQRSYAQMVGEKPPDTGFSILVRFIAGIPSDVIWRQSAMKGLAVAPRPGLVRRDNKMFAKMFVAFSTAVALLLGGFMLFTGVGRFLGHGADALGWGLVPVVGGALLLASVAVARRSPRKATIMVAVAALALAGTYYWLIPIGLPITIILIAGAVIRAKEPVPVAP